MTTENHGQTTQPPSFTFTVEPATIQRMTGAEFDEFWLAAGAVVRIASQVRARKRTRKPKGGVT